MGCWGMIHNMSYDLAADDKKDLEFENHMDCKLQSAIHFSSPCIHYYEWKLPEDPPSHRYSPQLPTLSTAPPPHPFDHRPRRLVSRRRRCL